MTNPGSRGRLQSSKQGTRAAGSQDRHLQGPSGAREVKRPRTPPNRRVFASERRDTAEPVCHSGDENKPHRTALTGAAVEWGGQTTALQLPGPARRKSRRAPPTGKRTPSCFERSQPSGGVPPTLACRVESHSSRRPNREIRVKPFGNRPMSPRRCKRNSLRGGPGLKSRAPASPPRKLG